MRYVMHSCVIAMGLVFACMVVPKASAQELTPGRRLTQAMGYAETAQDSLDVCNEKMEGHDVEKTLEATPGLLGGIKPGDAEWPEARALYIDLLKAGCDYDMAVPEDAFARAMEGALSPTDIDALVTFYASELGGKYRIASLKANNASFRATKPRVETDVSYAEYGKKLQALLARRPKPVEEVRDLKTVQALPTPDAAVALSDQIMKGVSTGRIRQALEIAVPHAVLTQGQIDSLIKQIEEQQPTMATSFGASLGYELLRNDTVGGSLQRTVFLHRFDKHSMVWMFLWYRGRDGWILNNVSYVNNPALLFQ